jgi:hypothetical protein
VCFARINKFQKLVHLVGFTIGIDSIILVTDKRFDFRNEVLVLNRAEQWIKKCKKKGQLECK